MSEPSLGNLWSATAARFWLVCRRPPGSPSWPRACVLPLTRPGSARSPRGTSRPSQEESASERWTALRSCSGSRINAGASPGSVVSAAEVAAHRGKIGPEDADANRRFFEHFRDEFRQPIPKRWEIVAVPIGPEVRSCGPRWRGPAVRPGGHALVAGATTPPRPLKPWSPPAAAERGLARDRAARCALMRSGSGPLPPSGATTEAQWTLRYSP